MIAAAEALRQILAYKIDFGTEEVPLLQSLNRVLAAAVTADRDMPPYDRVMMDGIAICGEVFNEGARSFFVEKIQPAGMPAQQLDDRNNCIEVMTGAVLPGGTNVVIPYEECDVSNGIAIVKAAAVKPYQNVHRRGSDGKKGAPLLEAGNVINPAHIGLIASVGISKVSVYQLPAVAVCSTGNELVEVDEMPLAHQVRKSNVYMLAAALQKEGIQAKLYHLPDDKQIMQEQLKAIIESCDVLLLSGAVSKGKFDYLPEVLDSLGMQTVFHRVAQKPGKPFLFGVLENNKPVFGFPGNPLSTFVCYQVYFKEWLHQCLHRKSNATTARLSTDISFLPKLANHLLVQVHSREGIVYATPVTTNNSGDMSGFLQADGIITLPPEETTFKKEAVFGINYC